MYAPSAVITELSHPRSPEAVRTWASSPPEWLDIQDPTHTDPSLNLGRGETAVISLALEIKADCVLIDERKGYKATRQRGLRVTTTLGILEEAAHRGLVDFEETVNRLAQETTFYVTEAVLAEFRRRVRNRTLADERGEAEGNPPTKATGRNSLTRDSTGAIPARSASEGRHKSLQGYDKDLRWPFGLVGR
jgi:predicted nucleic acid-binding protein